MKKPIKRATLPVMAYISQNVSLEGPGISEECASDMDAVKG
jgi:hypothetical protein